MVTGLLRMTFRPGGDDGGLGRAVGVDDAAARLPPALDQIRRALLAAENQQPHRRHVFVHHRKQRGHARKHRHARIREHSGKRRARMNHFLVADHECRAREKCQPDFLDGGVERDGKSLINPVFRPHLENLPFAPHEMAGAAMFDLHALRLAGRAGGVNDVAKVFRRRAGFGGA